MAFIRFPDKRGLIGFFPIITPSPGASDGTLQDWLKLGSDNARR